MGRPGQMRRREKIGVVAIGLFLGLWVGTAIFPIGEEIALANRINLGIFGGRAWAWYWTSAPTVNPHSIVFLDPTWPSHGCNLLPTLVLFRSAQWKVALPLWMPLAGATALTAWCWWNNRFARTPGLCPVCGYDVRFTRGRCPECSGGKQ